MSAQNIHGEGDDVPDDEVSSADVEEILPESTIKPQDDNNNHNNNYKPPPKKLT